MFQKGKVRIMRRVTTIKNNLADARTLWKNGIDFWITSEKSPYFKGWLINKAWREKNASVDCLDKLCEMFKERQNDGKRPVFYVVK